MRRNFSGCLHFSAVCIHSPFSFNTCPIHFNLRPHILHITYVTYHSTNRLEMSSRTSHVTSSLLHCTALSREFTVCSFANHSFSVNMNDHGVSTPSTVVLRWVLLFHVFCTCPTLILTNLAPRPQMTHSINHWTVFEPRWVVDFTNKRSMLMKPKRHNEHRIIRLPTKFQAISSTIRSRTKLTHLTHCLTEFLEFALYVHIGCDEYRYVRGAFSIAIVNQTLDSALHQATWVVVNFPHRHTLSNSTKFNTDKLKFPTVNGTLSTVAQLDDIHCPVP